MKILGIDPGVAIVGYGIIKADKHNEEIIDYGCILTDKATPHAERLAQISTEINRIIKKYRPQALAIEELFFSKNVKTALKVGEARGIVLARAMSAKLPIYEYTPLQIKQALTGYGRADKRQIQQMVRMILKLDKLPQPDDAADALAVAITCAHSLNINSQQI